MSSALALVALVLLIATAVNADSNTVSVQQDGGGGQNCIIVNDMVNDNGVQRRLTTEEREKLRLHNEAWQQWSIKFGKNMRRKFGKGFPFNKDNGEGKSSSSSSEESSGTSTKPEFPCICSGCTQPSQNPPQ